MFEPDERYLRNEIGDDEADAAGAAAEAIEHARQRADDRAALADVAGGERGHERALR